MSQFGLGRRRVGSTGTGPADDPGPAGTDRRPATTAVAGLLLCLLLAVSVSTPAAARGGGSEVDAFVADYLATHRLPGATVALVRDGQVVHEAGYGRSSTGATLSADSAMRIESVSKTITAFAVLQLVEQGRLGLDDPVVQHLPEFGVAGGGGAEITVRQLLSHTSGLVTPTFVRPAQTLAEGVSRTREWSLSSEPGSTYRYSNANYWIAARLTEVVADRPFDAYLTEEVFAPAGMADTTNATTTVDPPHTIAPGQVTSWGLALPVDEVPAMTSGAGGVISTAGDLARWLAIQQNGGRTPEGRRLLSPELIMESHRVQPNANRSGLGWMRSVRGDPPLIQYSGVGTAYNAQVMLDPATGNGAVVLLNSFTPTREHAYAIASGILQIAVDRPPEVGRPVAVWIDLGLAALTVATLLGGVRGVRRAGPWVARRRQWPGWRIGLRLLPQLVAPALATLVFLIAPAVQANAFTPVDVVGLYPALMVLLVALAVVGLFVTGARVGRLRVPAGRAGSGGRRNHPRRPDRLPTADRRGHRPVRRDR